MFKKILGLAICVASVVSPVAPSYAAEDTAWKTELLRGLGVYQENPVTYDNFIGSLAGFLYDNAAEMGSAEEIARSTGMIEDDEAYSGSSGLTIEEACELAVITLGYKPALGKDGNYMSKASELGIADGIGGNGNNRLKADVAVEILYNMLEAEPLIKTLSGKQEPQYAVAYDENLLSINRDIRKVKGLVTGTEITAIYGDSYLAQKDCIAIDNVSYYVGTNKFDALLGKNVVAYIQEADDLYDKALYVGEAKGKNETVIIDCDDITYIGNSISYIKYEADTKIKKIDIVASPRVIYNGKFLEDYVEDNFRHGTLEIIDNNNDGKYDVIKVSAYQTIVVEAIDTQERIIKNRYTFNDRLPELQLSDMKNDNIVFRIFDSTGSEADFSVIKTDDVLSVLKSRDGKLIDIYISGGGCIEGEVTGTDNAEDIVRIDSDSYKKSEDFNKHLSKVGKTIRLGNTYTFYIDYFGKIAYIKEDTYSDYNVLVKVGIDEGKDEYYIVYMDMNGDWYTSTVYEKTKIDGVRPADMSGAMNTLKSEGPQVVILKLNSKNQIINIDTAGKVTDSEFTKKTASNYTYRSEPRYFQSQQDEIYLEDDAKVIVFPSDNIKDKDNWKIYSAGSFFKSNVDYTIDCFNLDDFMFTDLVTVVQSNDVAKARVGKGMYVVTDFATTLIDDEPHPVIKGSVDGFMNLSFIGKDASVFTGLKKGDVINFALDHNGMIEYVESSEVFSLIPFTKEIGSYNGDSRYAGRVKDIDFEEGKLLMDCGRDIPFRVSPNMQITVYEEGEGCISKPLSSIDNTYNVLLRTYYGKVVEIVGVKN